MLRVVDTEEQPIHSEFRVKLEALGYGFLVPVFFVTTGVALDFKGLFHQPSHLVLVPVFLVALLWPGDARRCSTGAALVLTGALSVMLFPPAALAVLERGGGPRPTR